MQLELRLVDAGHILEGDLLRVAGEKFGLRLAERERLVAARLHLPHKEDPEADEEQDRCPGDEGGDERRVARRLELHRHALRLEKVVHGGVAGWCGGGEFALAARRRGA